MERNTKNASEDLDQILDQALEHLKQGASINDCLLLFPAHAAFLEPLLTVAADMQATAATVLPPEMEAWLAAGAREFAVLAEQVHEAPAPALAPQRVIYARRTDPADDVLDCALRGVKRGESVAAVLARQPQSAAHEAQLHTAACLYGIAATPMPQEMEAWVATTGLQEFRILAERALPRTATRPARSRTLTTQRAAAATLIAVALIGTVDTASAASVAGQPLYGWKRAHEDINVALTTNPVARASLLVNYAQVRVGELQTLVNEGVPPTDQRIASTVASIKDHMLGVINEAQQNSSVAALKPQAAKVIQDAQEVLGTEQSVPQPSTNAAAALADTQAQLDRVETQIASIPDVSPTATAGEAVALGPSATATVPVPSSTTTQPSAIVGQAVTPQAGTNTASTSTVDATGVPVGTQPSATVRVPTITAATSAPQLTGSTATTAAGGSATAVPTTASTAVPTAEPTDVGAPSETPIGEATATASPRPTSSGSGGASTAQPTNTSQPTSDATNTAIPTAPATATLPSEPTELPPPTAPARPTTRPPISTSTATTVPPISTSTATTVPPTSTPTATAVLPTDEPTDEPTSTSTVTNTPTNTATATPTIAPTVTNTPTVTATPTPTATLTPTATTQPEETAAPTATSTTGVDVSTPEPTKTGDFGTPGIGIGVTVRPSSVPVVTVVLPFPTDTPPTDAPTDVPTVAPTEPTATVQPTNVPNTPVPPAPTEQPVPQPTSVPNTPVPPAPTDGPPPEPKSADPLSQPGGTLPSVPKSNQDGADSTGPLPTK